MYPAQAPGAGTGAAARLVAKGFGWWKKGGCRAGVGCQVLPLVLVLLGRGAPPYPSYQPMGGGGYQAPGAPKSGSCFCVLKEAFESALSPTLLQFLS